MAVGVLEERHLEVVIVHPGDQVRGKVKLKPRRSNSAQVNAISAQRK
jgi:hypothetical protein